MQQLTLQPDLGPVAYNFVIIPMLVSNSLLSHEETFIMFYFCDAYFYDFWCIYILGFTPDEGAIKNPSKALFKVYFTCCDLAIHTDTNFLCRNAFVIYLCISKGGFVYTYSKQQ